MTILKKGAKALGLAMLLSTPFHAALADAPPPQNPNLLFWSQEERDTWFRDIDRIVPTRKIEASETPLELPEALQDFSSVSYELEGETLTLEEYMERFNTMGLLVLKDGKILHEAYRAGHTKESRWISFSVTKSVSSMMIGAAIQDGFIKSVDDPVTDYLPRLRGSAYDQATIKHVLQMSSGVEWNEDYFDPQSDVSQAAALNAMQLFDYLNTKGVAAEPGEKFNYNTGETNLVGAIVRAAVGNNQSAYLEHKIWQPFGMESDAYWLIDETYAVETGGCCINATLRDYARIGLFALGGGVLADGTRVLPEGFMADSVVPSKGYNGYGYLWWLKGDGRYAAQGIFGQMIHINPEENIVIAVHSSWPAAVGKELQQHRGAMIDAIEAHLTE